MKLFGCSVLLVSTLTACLCADIPCDDNYVAFTEIKGERVARIKVRDDHSGRYEVVVDSTLPYVLDRSRPILVVGEYPKNFSELVYTLKYPGKNQTYPRIKQIIFNDVVLCKENASPDDGVIHKTTNNLTSIDKIQFVNNNRVAREVSNFITKDDSQCGVSIEEEDGFPWLGALFSYEVEVKNYEYVCTVTLITKQHAITAASCVQNQNMLNYDPDDMILIFGKSRLDNWVQNSVIAYVDKVTVHPDLVQKKAGPDLAIITLSTPLYFSKKVHPICLEGQTVSVNSGTVSGWAKTRQNQVRSSTAFRMNVEQVDREDCVQVNPTLQEDHFCTGEKDSKGPCGRNAGVGYAVEKDKIYHLHGIATFLDTQRPHTCENYTIFTDVTKEFNWIDSVIN